MKFKNAPHCKGSIKSAPEYKAINWSGGTSTELFIFPPTADFSKRDFGFRLSIATVAIEESTFTRLVGVHRILLLLEGNFTLSHTGHHSKTLLPFDQDQFEGDWETQCSGMGKDFNLLFKSPYKGTVKVVADETVTIDTHHTLILSLAKNCTIDGEELKNNDLMIIENLGLKTNQIIELKGKFIIVTIIA
jgi:environmental stress-induced protein Ves